MKTSLKTRFAMKFLCRLLSGWPRVRKFRTCLQNIVIAVGIIFTTGAIYILNRRILEYSAINGGHGNDHDQGDDHLVNIYSPKTVAQNEIQKVTVNTFKYSASSTVSLIDVMSDEERINNLNLAENCMKLRPKIDPEMVKQCNYSFGSLEQNMQKIKQWPIEHALPYFPKLGLDKYLERNLSNILPTFVTGASSNHYLEVQGVIKDMHQIIMVRYPASRLIFYDLGLQPHERQQMIKHCRCEVRTWNPYDYPKHVHDLQTFAWKIIILQLVANETGAAMWMDASVRFKTSNLDPTIQLARRTGIATWDTDFTPVALTNPRTFNFLGEPRCLYKDLTIVEPGAVMIYLNHMGFEYIMRPLMACALAPECISPVGASAYSCSYPKDPNMYRCCHRFDQSVFSILMQRLYQLTEKRAQYRTDFVHTFRRGNLGNYFH